jgi:hypothetical protein
MIARFLDVLVAGEPSPVSPAAVRVVAQLTAERDRVLGFAASYCGFKLAVWLYYQARRFLYHDVAAVRGDAAVRALLEAPCEPPDFFVIEPPQPAAVPVAMRAAWLGQLAALIVPFAPDGSDRAVLDCARRIAAAMLDEASDRDRDPIDRVRATFSRLDAIHGELIGCVESGLRGARHTGPIDEATRDRLVAASPRAMFAALR